MSSATLCDLNAQEGQDVRMVRREMARRTLSLTCWLSWHLWDREATSPLTVGTFAQECRHTCLDVLTASSFLVACRHWPDTGRQHSLERACLMSCFLTFVEKTSHNPPVARRIDIGIQSMIPSSLQPCLDIPTSHSKAAKADPRNRQSPIANRQSGIDNRQSTQNHRTIAITKTPFRQNHRQSQPPLIQHSTAHSNSPRPNSASPARRKAPRAPRTQSLSASHKRGPNPARSHAAQLAEIREKTPDSRAGSTCSPGSWHVADPPARRSWRLARRPCPRSSVVNDTDARGKGDDVLPP